MTSWPSADQHRWPHESIYFQAILAMDHLDHLFTKRNRNKYACKAYQKSFTKTLVPLVRVAPRRAALARSQHDLFPRT